MSDKLEVIITGKNGVSRIFQEVTKDAQTMGTGVEASGKRASQSFANWSSAAQKAGAAIGSVAALSIIASGQAEASQARIEGAFENANLAIEDYQDSIDRLSDRGLDLAFDDEDVADSIAKLVGVTKDAERAFDDLAIAQDVARGEQISLAAATNLIEAAEAGRFRGLAQLGIVLDSTATKEDYLAAVRDKYAGASERFAATGEADFMRWQNTAENALEAVGAKLGAVQGPLLALSASSTLLGTVGGLLKDVGAGGAIASLALGPVGLTAAALAAGAGILYLVTRGEEWVDVAQTAALATDNLDNFFASLASTLDPFRSGVISDLNEQLNQMITDAAQRQSDLEKIVNLKTFTTGMGINLSEVEEDFTGLTQAQLAWLDTNRDSVLSLEEIDAAIVQYQGNLDRLNVDQVEAVQTAITNLLSRPNVDITKAAGDIQLWIDQLNSGAIDGEQFVALVTDAATHFADYITAVEGATDAQRAFNLQMVAASEAMNTQAGDLDNLLEPKRIAAALGQRAALLTLADSLKTVEENTVEAVLPTGYFTDALDVQVKKAEDAKSAIAEYAAALGNVPEREFTPGFTAEDGSRIGPEFFGAEDGSRVAAEFYGATLDNLAAHATQAGAALGDAFRVAVGNTDAIANQSQQTADWAKELINVEGIYGKIDDLLKKGLINQYEWTTAQESANVIFAQNERIQDSVATIQAKQAPIIAQLTAEQAKYMDQIAALPMGQQAVALAYMDTNTVMKAQESWALAASAAQGELGVAGEESAQKMIEGAVKADPYLRKMLEDMGLISVGANGEITVNFDQVDDAAASLQDVVDVLTDMKDLLQQVFDIKVEADTQDAMRNLNDVSAKVLGLDDTSATVDVGADTSPFWNAVNGLLGQTVGTAYMALDYLGIAGKAHGGIVPAANGIAAGSGGRDVLVGEFGPEIAHLPGGSFVLPTGASRGRGGPGGITIGPLIVQGNVYDSDKLIFDLTGQLVPALVLALEQYYAGMGVR